MDEHMEYMDDSEIQEKVESLVGKGTKVVDCKKSTSFQTQEILLVNGHPIPLHGDEGVRIKEALLEGQVPSGDILNEILIRAGILKAPVELETTMNIKSTKKFTELLTFRDKNGILIDERMKETEEDNEFNGTSTERWKKENVTSEEQLESLGKRVDKIHIGNTHNPTHVLDGIVPAPLSQAQDCRPQTSNNHQNNNNNNNSSSNNNDNDSDNKKEHECHANHNDVRNRHAIFKPSMTATVSSSSLGGNSSTSITQSHVNGTTASIAPAVPSRLGAFHSSDSSKTLCSPQFLKPRPRKSECVSLHDVRTKPQSQCDVNVYNRSPTTPSLNASHRGFTMDYMDPILNALQPEINKVPVRVSYETFV